MIKRLLNLRGLFSNTKFLVVFSAVLALIFWIVVALEYTPIIQNVIEEVPVKIELKDTAPERLGLKPFSDTNITVDITVEGKRYDVGGKKLTADDFVVEAETAYVDSAGEKALALKVAPKNTNAEFEIVELSADYINVFFDREATKEISLTPKVSSPTKEIVADGYTFYEEEISVEKTITITGPKTEVDKIQGAYLEVTINEPLTSTKVVEGSVKFITASDDEIKYVKVDGETPENVKLTATIPVYKIQTLPVSVSFTHSPKEYLNNPLKYSSVPSTVNVAVLQDGSGEVSVLDVGEINFSQITPDKKVFEFDATDIKNAKILDNTEKIYIYLQLPETIVTESLSVYKNNIIIEGAQNEDVFSIDFSDSKTVTVCSSTKDQVEISPESLQGKIDLTGVTVTTEGKRVPIEFNVKYSDESWVAGTYYATVKSK